MIEHSGIDQAILDEIGVESTDSEIEEEDYLPVPSLYAKSQSRNSSLSRSNSTGSFDTCESSVQVDYNRYSGVNFGAGNTVMPSPKRLATGIESQKSAQSPGSGMRRCISMPCIQKTQSDYNRAFGEALANSPKKAPVSTGEDLAIMEKLLSQLWQDTFFFDI